MLDPTRSEPPRLAVPAHRVPRTAFQGLLALSLLALTSLGCGGGGGIPAATPFAGGWYLTRVDLELPCGAKPELELPVTITQAGDEVSALSEAGDLTGRATGASASFAGRLVLADVTRSTYVFYSDVILERVGDVLVGTATISESASLTGTSRTCEGIVRLKAVPEMRLMAFNMESLSGQPLNNPLIFRFSQDVDTTTISPDTISITGVHPPHFETISVDGPYLALLPTVPNFRDFTDAGLQPDVEYTVSLSDYMDPMQIRSTLGARLMPSMIGTFQTTPLVSFIEPRRPLLHVHGPTGMPPGTGDEEGCLNNAETSLFVPPGLQTGSDPAAELLCLVNEGPPQIIPESCTPAHDDRDVAVGPEGTVPGTWSLPAIRIAFNEPLDPRALEDWDPASLLGPNVQLWRVGDAAGNPIPAAEMVQVATNRPVSIQDTLHAELILVSIADQPSGTYLVNVRNLTDLPGNPLAATGSPSPAVGGYTAIESSLAGVVPPGYRYYFRTP